VTLVDEDTDKHLYQEATRLRAQNIDVYAAARQTTFRDDRAFGVTLDDISLHNYTSQIQNSNVAINSWGGWFDASTADAVIRSFMTLSNYQRAVIGPWNHGGGQNASPYQGDQALRVMQGYEWLRFFDHYLKGAETGLDSQKLLYYFTLGEGNGRPRQRVLQQTKASRWYLSEGNALLMKPVAAGGPLYD
jgi:putative CocE/NonD family hydrolase